MQRQIWIRRLIKNLLPNPGTLVILLLFIWVQSTGAAPWSAPAAAPGSATTINYQGRLFNSSGQVVNGAVSLAFSLYKQASGGNPVWGPETHNNVPVTDGLFSVLLGSQTPIPLSTISGDLWLETKVNGETLSPRELLGAVPIAMTVPDRALTSRHVHLTSGKISPTANLGLTTSDQLIPGMKVNLAPATNQTYLFYLVAEFIDQGVTEGYGAAKLYIDGVPASGGIAALMDWDADLGTVVQVYRVDIPAGSHTVEVQASSSNGGGQIWRWHTSLTWFAVSQ